MSDSRLFQPLKVGSIELKNRIAMAPLTRFRASDSHAILPFAAEYYGQRASVPGTLLITEATDITARHGGQPNVPAIETQEQIDAWKKVTAAVHEKGSFIFLQIWALGRVANKEYAQSQGIEVKSSSAIQLSDDLAVPKEMTVEEIEDTVGAFAQAAKNAVEAGFDGVEIHGANGYLIDQFLQDTCNKRTDNYGGSIENRSRFAIEVAQAIVAAVGADKTAIRLSPFADFQGMKMDDPIPQFSHLIKELNKLNLAYLHVVQAFDYSNADLEDYEALKPLYPLYTSGPILVAGGFKAATARKFVDQILKDRDVVVVFGRYFISTPDLVFRLEKGIDFNPYDRDTFYLPKSEKGYTDYPFSEDFKKQANP